MSLKRSNKFESKEAINKRQNYSRPKQLVSKSENINLESIKNNILRIKEKAFGNEDELWKPIGIEQKTKLLESQIKAQVTISTIDLANIQSKSFDLNPISQQMSIKGATSISKHNTNKSINLDSSSSYPIARDSYQISNLKEEESNELLESLPAKITQIKPKESLVSLDNSKYEKEEYTNNINIISNLEKSKSLEYKYEISAVESKHKPFESKEVSKDKTVRFKDSIKHSRQSSELDNYSELLVNQA